MPERLRGLVHSLVGEWRTARDREVGLSRHHDPGTHRRWVSAGHSILSELADAYHAWTARPPATADFGQDVYDRVETFGRRVLNEQQLEVSYGPLHRAVSRGGRR